MGVGAVVTALPAPSPIPGSILPEGLLVPSSPSSFCSEPGTLSGPLRCAGKAGGMVKRYSGFPNEHERSLPDESSRITCQSLQRVG